MNCGTCKHWNLTGQLGQLGYGRCAVRMPLLLREAMTTGAQNVCRIDKFAVADRKTIQMREMSGGSLL